MKIDATDCTIKIELTTAEAVILLEDIGDLRAKTIGPKLRQFYRQLYAPLKLRRLLNTG